VIGLFWEGIPLTLLVLLSGLGQVSAASIEAARDVGAGPFAILFAIVIPLIRRSLLVAFALDFLSIFGSFTTPYLLGPASPEIMGVYMQRTFIALRLPIQAQTEAVVSFLICALVGLFYVRAIARSRKDAER
jgi:ABC-type spermidine/putrescine transport system permease subunit I